MWRTAAFIACTATCAPGGLALADGTADDLAVVKRAVEKEDDGAPRVDTRRSPEKARWFRVRIEDRKGSKVKVNLPLGLVRDLGDALPIDWGCGRKHRGCKMRLSEVLDLLDAGEDLVEISDEEATVRIWVD